MFSLLKPLSYLLKNIVVVCALFSGIIWPIQAIPYPLYYIALALPQTYAAEALRAVMSKGEITQNPTISSFPFCNPTLYLLAEFAPCAPSLTPPSPFHLSLPLLCFFSPPLTFSSLSFNLNVYISLSHTPQGRIQGGHEGQVPPPPRPQKRKK